MRLKSYFANSLEQALRAAKIELGEEAMLVDSKLASGQARGFGRLEVVFAYPSVSPGDSVKKQNPENEPDNQSEMALRTPSNPPASTQPLTHKASQANITTLFGGDSPASAANQADKLNPSLASVAPAGPSPEAVKASKEQLDKEMQFLRMRTRMELNIPPLSSQTSLPNLPPLPQRLELETALVELGGETLAESWLGRPSTAVGSQTQQQASTSALPTEASSAKRPTNSWAGLTATPKSSNRPASSQTVLEAKGTVIEAMADIVVEPVVEATLAEFLAAKRLRTQRNEYPNQAANLVQQASFIQPNKWEKPSAASIHRELLGLSAQLSQAPSLVATSLAATDFSSRQTRRKEHEEEDKLFEMLGQMGLVDELFQHIFRTCRNSSSPDRFALTSALGILTRNLSVRPASTQDKGSLRIVAALGPSGAGKSSLLLKLAIRDGLAAGRTVTLVHLDGNRIGEADVTRRLAELAGIAFQQIQAPGALIPFLAQHQQPGLLLLDLPGMAPSDEWLIREVAAALDPFPLLERHLVVPATLQEATLRSTYSRMQALHPTHLAITHVDEIGHWGPVCSLLWQSKLPLSYLSTGWSIPEDLADATLADLKARIVASLRSTGQDELITVKGKGLAATQGSR